MKLSDKQKIQLDRWHANEQKELELLQTQRRELKQSETIGRVSGTFVSLSLSFSLFCLFF